MDKRWLENSILFLTVLLLTRARHHVKIAYAVHARDQKSYHSNFFENNNNESFEKQSALNTKSRSNVLTFETVRG